MRFLFYFTIFFTSAFAKVVELQSFKDLESHLTSDTLILLDIDDTLLITKQMLGCDEWFLYRNTLRKDEGMDRLVALEKSLAEWEGIRHFTEMEIVEPGTDAIVRDLQNRGFTVMGLTTQGLALATRTVQQLGANKLDLSITAPSEQDLFFTLGNHGVLYRHGILFTSGQQKGKALLRLCDAFGISPKRIVFVNDKRTNIAEIEGLATERGIEFLGLRYAYSDARKAAFSAQIADVQFTQSNFGHILSDDEAKTILQTSCL